MTTAAAPSSPVGSIKSFSHHSTVAAVAAVALMPIALSVVTRDRLVDENRHYCRPTSVLQIKTKPTAITALQPESCDMQSPSRPHPSPSPSPSPIAIKFYTPSPPAAAMASAVSFCNALTKSHTVSQSAQPVDRDEATLDIAALVVHSATTHGPDLSVHATSSLFAAALPPSPPPSHIAPTKITLRNTTQRQPRSLFH